MEFEWDPAKAQTNLQKRGVTFEEAASAFADPLAAFFRIPIIPMRKIAKSWLDTRRKIDC